MPLQKKETLFPYNGKDQLFPRFFQKLQIQTNIVIDFKHQQY